MARLTAARWAPTVKELWVDPLFHFLLCSHAGASGLFLGMGRCSVLRLHGRTLGRRQ